MYPDRQWARCPVQSVCRHLKVHRESAINICYLNTCMLACLGFIHTLEIIARMLSEVVNRDRLYGTNVFSAGFRNFWGFKPLEEVPTQSSFVWLLDSKMVQ